MPGFDGTGPRGNGPMSGKASGFCLLHIPDEPGEPWIGFAGRAGEPIAPGCDIRRLNGRWLQFRLWEMQAALAAMKFRLNNLESGYRPAPPRRPGTGART